jgi:CHAT domain-containing protein
VVTVRYAHNARTLVRAGKRAEQFAQQTLDLLAVAAPGGDPRRPLPNTVVEVAQIVRRWTRAQAVTDGTSSAVEQMLTSHNVWHFACHCQAFPNNVLDSALLLADGRFSLRAILALAPVPRRLAILSACETHLSGTDLPDEAMGLPAGLLQAGFAGVVATHWSVNDRSAALLMIRFHELWHGQGLSPAVALAEAQHWLRTARPADLRMYGDGAHGQPGGEHFTGRAIGKGSGHFGHPYFWASFALTGQ